MTQCSATACEVEGKPVWFRVFFCPRHWSLLPLTAQHLLIRERDASKEPSERLRIAKECAVSWLAGNERTMTLPEVLERQRVLTIEAATMGVSNNDVIEIVIEMFPEAIETTGPAN